MKTLVIGSSDIDLFVAPSDSSSYVQNEKTISFTLGDKVLINMNAMTLGGNGANVSTGLQKLGLDTSFYTFFGTDLLSQQIKQSIEANGVKLIEHPSTGDTASLSIIFDFKDDRIIFPYSQQREHVFDPDHAKDFQALYVTSIGKEWVPTYQQIVSYIHSNQMVVAFSPGSPQYADLQDVVFEMIASSEILFVNKEEGEHILSKKGKAAADMKELLSELATLGPQMVSVTDGKQGAYLTAQGIYYHLPSFVEKMTTVDKTGSGDAYASGFFAAYLQGKDAKTCMRWGSVNAYGVMSKIGGQAGLMDFKGIENALSTRVDFQVEEM